MFILTVLFGYLPLNAQRSHVVDVTNNIYTPAELTINVGDTVIWTNSQGFHNVNGTTDTYPSNPESFGNSTGSGWTYSYVFNTVGSYDYQCDPHVGFGMTGIINVVETTVNIEPLLSNSFELYPNPANDVLYIRGTNNSVSDIQTVDFINASGQIVYATDKLTIMRSEYIDISGLGSGMYLVKIHTNNGVHTLKLIKR